MYGSKITSIRLARGYTQEYVADKAGINQRTYSRIEKDAKVKVEDELLEKIAAVLGVSLEDIKNPMPIVMTFHHSPYSGQINSQENKSDTAIVDTMKEQLQLIREQNEILKEESKQKNKIIEQLMQLLEVKKI